MKRLKPSLFLSISVIVLAGLSACDLLAPAREPDGIQVPTPVSGMEILVVTPTSTPMEASAPPPPTRVKIAAAFDMSNSGSICPNRSPEREFGLPSHIGDLGDTYTCEGFWTFDVSEIPTQASILSATFLPGECTIEGDPFAQGSEQGDVLGFEVVKVGSLDVADWGQGGFEYFSFHKCPDAIDLTAYLQSQSAIGFDTVQIRGYFISGNYSNGKDDYIAYETGLIPVLTVEYSDVP